MIDAINSFFKLKERKTNPKTEVLAGITTFLSMAYILFVNPDILSAAGMPADSVFVATAIAAIIGTTIMALYANYPVAQAPGMGMNAFFAFTICGEMGYSFGQGLLVIFTSGLIFVLLAATKVREKIINAIPSSLKYAVSAGVGLFITFVGLQGSGIIVASESTLVTLGPLNDPNVILAAFGIVLTLVLVARKVKGGIFIGLLLTAVAGMAFGVVDVPTKIVGSIPSLEPIAFKLFDFNVFDLMKTSSFWFLVFSALFLDFFDTAGTLMGVATRAGLLDDEGKLIDSDKALMSDATATTIGAVIGTSSVTSYAESVVGVEAGGRTGLTALTTSFCFLLALFFSPLLSVITSAVTAPALISVGAMMMSSNKHVNYDDFSDACASFLTMVFMILAYSIAEGIAVGFTVYVILKVASGKQKEVSPIMYGLAVLFILFFVSKAM
ncbi:NCS2 family permease [Mycoplasma sp. P36-A1]|uniref:NCS2 family permease n=1 Tax=Mycoplasma sp. P36-A1 TaxID=3252900 RepID=UPI003C2C0AF7